MDYFKLVLIFATNIAVKDAQDLNVDQGRWGVVKLRVFFGTAKHIWLVQIAHVSTWVKNLRQFCQFRSISDRLICTPLKLGRRMDIATLPYCVFRRINIDGRADTWLIDGVFAILQVRQIFKVGLVDVWHHGRDNFLEKNLVPFNVVKPWVIHNFLNRLIALLWIFL